MTYAQNIQPVGYLAGQVANSNPVAYETLPNTNTSLAINFGLAMAFDGTNGGYKSPAASGDITNRMAVNGIILRMPFYSYANANGDITITGQNNSVPVGAYAAGITTGAVAVLVEEAVTVGQQCFIRYASGAGGTILGSFRASADTATAAAHPTWYYETAAAIGTIAIVRVS